MIARIPFSRSHASSFAADALPSQSPGKISDTLVTGRSSEGGSRTWNLCQPEGTRSKKGSDCAKLSRMRAVQRVCQAHLRHSSFESARRGGRYGCAQTDARERAKRSILGRSNVPPASRGTLARPRMWCTPGSSAKKAGVAAFNLRFNGRRQKSVSRTGKDAAALAACASAPRTRLRSLPSATVGTSALR